MLCQATTERPGPQRSQQRAGNLLTFNAPVRKKKSNGGCSIAAGTAPLIQRARFDRSERLFYNRREEAGASQRSLSKQEQASAGIRQATGNQPDRLQPDDSDMIVVLTRRGKRIDILFESELRDPRLFGRRVRAFCPIHGSDHQRSLSIDRNSGWGHCFNAACHARVLVAEWNPAAAQQLLADASAAVAGHDGGPTSFPPAALPMVSSAAATSEAQSSATAAAADQSRWQQQELQALHALHESMQEALQRSQRGRIYLEERGLSPELALTHGAGLLTAREIARLSSPWQQRLLQRWQQRLIFPLRSAGQQGYIGRTLWGWQPRMDEQRHKQLLERAPGPPRWIKTNPAGWFTCEPAQLATCIVLVEGAFDRLTLLAAGWRPEEVVALVGTAAATLHLPPQVRSVLLALDGDTGGRAATLRLRSALRAEGLRVRCALPPQDGQGKDWNERWRRLGMAGIRPLLEACEQFR
jgi:hypothetical protein